MVSIPYKHLKVSLRDRIVDTIEKFYNTIYVYSNLLKITIEFIYTYKLISLIEILILQLIKIAAKQIINLVPKGSLQKLEVYIC